MNICPLTRSLDLFGDRWGLLVVRELLRGVTHFNELERSLPGISRSTLAQRLRQLEKETILERLPSADGRWVEYGLTESSRDLRTVLDAMGGWGVRWLVPHSRASAHHPGFVENVSITAPPLDLYHLVSGRLSMEEAMEEGAVRVDGPPALVCVIPRWLLLRASGPPITPEPNGRRVAAGR
jgi:DNA-binding HxlR family transcriptional regulator